jgi:hypothetical protein
MNHQPCFKRIGETLYRYSSSQRYYAILKIRGKQIKRCLKTSHLPEARRKLRDFKSQLTRIDPFAARETGTAARGGQAVWLFSWM